MSENPPASLAPFAMLASLLRARRFAGLFWCQFFSAFNDNFVRNMLAMLILFRLGEMEAGPLISLAVGTFMAPSLFLSGLGGELADAQDKAWLARRLKFAEILVQAVAALGLTLASLPLLYTALFGLGVISALFGPVKYGILPDLLAKEELLAGNALVEAATFIAIFLGLIAGGLSVDGPKDLLIRLTLDILGLKYRYVTGYRGSQGARLALQQREINFYAESPPSFRSIIEPQLVAKGEVIGLYYDALWDGERFRKPRQVEGMSLLPFHEFYAMARGGQPSGRQWEAYKTIVALNASMQRMIVLPPGAPPAAIDALRAAITRLNDDREFTDDAMRTFGYAPEFVAGPDTSDKVRKALTTDPDTKAFMVEFMNAATK